MTRLTHTTQPTEATTLSQRPWCVVGMGQPSKSYLDRIATSLQSPRSFANLEAGT